MLKEIKSYIELVNSFSTYEVKVSTILDTISKGIITHLRTKDFIPEVHEYLKDYDDKAAPFSKAIVNPNKGSDIKKAYALDPDSISQIKTLLEALYFAKLAFLDLESASIDALALVRTVNDIKKLCGQSIHYGFLACQLLTQLDVAFDDIFSKEIGILWSFISQLMSKAKSYSDDKDLFEKTMKTALPLANKAGIISGVVVDQLQPNHGQLDYKFLTQLGGGLPGYIQEVTKHIQTLTNTFIEEQPKLTKEKLEEYRTVASRLLVNLNEMQGNDLFVSFKILNYINIVRHVITLLMSILDQTFDFNEKTQDYIRVLLKNLKDGPIRELFDTVDLVEVTCNVMPGNLSTPVMQEINKIYNFVIYYAGKYVDFEKKGAELLRIEDSHFISLRLERTYKRIQNENDALVKIEQAATAHKKFFEILDGLQNKTICISELEDGIKVQLIAHFKLFKSYMEKVDIDTAEALVKSLQGLATDDSWLSAPIRMIRRELPTDHLSRVMACNDSVAALICKDRISRNFHINNNQRLIRMTQTGVGKALFTINQAANAHKEFFEILNTIENKQSQIHELDKEIRTKLVGYYNLFKSYMKNIPLNITDALIYDPAINKNWQPLPSQGCTVTNVLTYKAQVEAQITNDPIGKNYLTENTQSLTSMALPQFDIALFPSKTSQNLFPINESLAFNNFNNTETNNLEYINTNRGLLLANPDKLTCKQAIVLSLWYEQIQLEEVPGNLTKPEAIMLSKWRERPGDEALAFNRSVMNNISFKESNSGFVIANPMDLNGEQTQILFQWYLNKHTGTINSELALSLYTWFENKRHQSTEAKEAYLQFMNLAGNTLPYLGYEEKNRTRILYNVFKTYFVSGAPDDKTTEVMDCDRYITRLFSGTRPDLNFLNSLKNHYINYFEQLENFWKYQSDRYLNLANEKYLVEMQAVSLEPNKNPRAHYLIKHTMFSETLVNFRISIQNLLQLLNETMNEELKVKNSKVTPYPEVEDPDLILAQPKQVIAFKQIYNCLDHGEQIILALEKIKDPKAQWDVTKPIYEWDSTVQHLVAAYNHIKHIVLAGQILIKDPHFTIIAQELLVNALGLLAGLQEHTYAYQVAPPSSTPGYQVIQLYPLWYIVNGVFVSPTLIRAKRDNNFISATELKELNLRADYATVTIERIINNSDSYFKLFLQSPEIFILYKRLKHKLKELASTSHDVVMKNLREIKSDVFASMLKQALLSEANIGLYAGSFFKPLKEILDTYFKGLLIPLGLPSGVHIRLVNDPCLLTFCKTATEARIELAKDQHRNNQLEYNYMEEFCQFVIDNNERLLKSSLEQAMTWPEAFTKELMEKYSKCLPTLVKLKRQLHFNINGTSKNPDFDLILNTFSKSYESNLHLKNILALITACHNYFIGLQNTLNISGKTAREQLNYLQKLENKQPEESLRVIDEYTDNAFERELVDLCSQPIGLDYMEIEYKEKLKIYLMQFEKNIIHGAKSAPEINIYIRKMLGDYARQYATDHFKNYYHLELIIEALKQFKAYLNTETVMEDPTSRKEKWKFINNVELLATCSKTPLEQRPTLEDRITNIKNAVLNDPNFSPKLCNPAEVKQDLWTQIRIWFIELMERLGLFPSLRKMQCTNIINAVEKEPDDTAYEGLTSRFGIFSTKPVIASTPVLRSIHTPPSQILVLQ